MVALENVAFVFVAGLLTALATGLGAVPFFLVEKFSDRWNVLLWGLASGIMVAASLFGLVREGLHYGSPVLLVPGLLTGVVLVVVAHEVLEDFDHGPEKFAEADFKKLLLILGILTVHSFPEGVAVGVSFAELGLDVSAAGETVAVAGVAVPLLAVFMTVAISIHNVPEGTAIAIPLRSLGVSEPKMVWWAVFSSLPQPIGAVVLDAGLHPVVRVVHGEVVRPRDLDGLAGPATVAHRLVLGRVFGPDGRLTELVQPGGRTVRFTPLDVGVVLGERRLVGEEVDVEGRLRADDVLDGAAGLAEVRDVFAYPRVSGVDSDVLLDTDDDLTAADAETARAERGHPHPDRLKYRPAIHS